MQKYIFASHFVTQNVTNAFDALQKYIFASHFVTQNVTNAFDALQKYIFASHFVTQNVTNAFLRTFYEVKCSASHFPKENVQQNKMLQMHLMLCKNIFDALQKCIFASNAFDAKMHLMQKCIFATRTFSKGKCSAVQKCIFASHFPLENVQHHILLVQKCILAYIFQRKMFSCAKMHLMRTFCNTKCYKCI